jgi:hypothetical protein
MSEVLKEYNGKVVSDIQVDYFDSDKGTKKHIEAIRIYFEDGDLLDLRPNILSQGNAEIKLIRGMITG